jgi:hypothetical protein
MVRRGVDDRHHTLYTPSQPQARNFDFIFPQTTTAMFAEMLLCHEVFLFRAPISNMLTLRKKSLQASSSRSILCDIWRIEHDRLLCISGEWAPGLMSL